MYQEQESEWRKQESEDLKRFLLLCVAMPAMILILFVLCSCTHGPLVSTSLNAERSANVSIKQHVAAARSDINQVLKDNSIIARPDLVMKLQDADGQLVNANTTIAQQAFQIGEDQKKNDALAAQGNAALAARDAMKPIQSRDRKALVVAWVLCSLACILGPLIFKTYPALVFFPTTLEALVCSIVAFCLCSGITALLILFGFL